MASDELGRSALARNGHMNRAAPHSPNAPERRGRSVAEHRTDAGRQHRCHRSAERRKAPLTDCIDPRHHDPQAPDREPVVDRVLRVAGYEVTRITWAQLDDEPEAIAADLRRLLDGNLRRRELKKNGPNASDYKRM